MACTVLFACVAKMTDGALKGMGKTKQKRFFKVLKSCMTQNLIMVIFNFTVTFASVFE